MKFKTLETVIREMHANRNTELRKKVPNVGRPDTAENPKDEKSRLYMQGQIKTKIIDEEQIDEISSETRDRYISGAVKDTLGHLKSEREGHKTPETKRKIKNRVGGMERAAIANRKAVEKKYSKEEVELDEISKEKLQAYTSAANKQIMSNYDKDGRKMPFSKEIDREKHVYKAQKKIIHKIMKEANDTENAIEVKDDDDKKKKSKDLVGGKTQIDLNPVTDDKIDNDSKETNDSKKARSKVNKEIGAKSASMKEEKMLYKDKFGLTDSLVNSVRQVMDEALKGNQKKLDKNHNGKLDKEDFKILRKEEKSCGCKGNCKCSTNEEVENVSETYSDDIAIHKDKESFRKHADQVNRKHHEDGAEDTNSRHGESYTSNGKTFARWHEKHSIGFVHSKGQHLGHHGGPKLMHEEVESIDEISKELAGRYVAKAAGDMHKRNAEHSKQQDAKIKAGTAMRNVKAAGPDKHETDSDHAERVNRLAKRRGKAEKAAHDAAKKASNRLSGIYRAGKTLAKEEVELSADELARIEEIAKGL